MLKQLIEKRAKLYAQIVEQREKLNGKTASTEEQAAWDKLMTDYRNVEAEIIIEERPAFEVTDMYYSKRMAPKDIRVYNPAFDITPASLISGIVTEKGILKPREIKSINSLK